MIEGKRVTTKIIGDEDEFEDFNCSAYGDYNSDIYLVKILASISSWFNKIFLAIF